jgi:hypothetical protein
MKFILTGDILFAGRIVVEADSAEQAIQKAQEGEFEVFDKSDKHLGFTHNGEEPERY